MRARQQGQSIASQHFPTSTSVIKCGKFSLDEQAKSGRLWRSKYSNYHFAVTMTASTGLLRSHMHIDIYFADLIGSAWIKD